MKDIEKWREEIGINLIARPEEDILKKTMMIGTKDLASLEPKELDNCLMVLADYHIFLRAQVGTITARVIYYEEMLENQLSLVTPNYSASHWNERRAMALRSDEKSKAINEKLLGDRMKLNMIGPFSDSIKVKIESLKKIFDRKIRERYVN